MPITRRSRVGINQTRRSRILNPQRVAAKTYVDEIKELRKVLKAIQKKYRDANKTVPKNLEKMNEAQNELRLVDFPELPEDTISKKIKPSERWGILATAFLWHRPLNSRRRPGDEFAERINAVFNFSEFKSSLNFLIHPTMYNQHELNEPDSNDSNDGPRPLAIIPRVRYGQAPPQFSLPYGFSPVTGTGTLPDYSSPPKYTRGGSKKKHKHKRGKKSIRK